VEWARRLTPWAELKLVVDARKDDKDFDEGLSFQIPETSLRRSILDLKEAVARFSRGAYEVSVGKQIFAWGTAVPTGSSVRSWAPASDNGRYVTLTGPTNGATAAGGRSC
jgi:hypothetical protein